MDLNKEVTAAKLTDDLAVEILSQLTYKSFCHCKCAYKAWSAFSSHPEYRKKLPKKVTTGLLYQSQNKSAIPLVSLSRSDGEIDGSRADLPHHEHLECLDCCNGLVLYWRNPAEWGHAACRGGFMFVTSMHHLSSNNPRAQLCHPRDNCRTYEL